MLYGLSSTPETCSMLLKIWNRGRERTLLAIMAFSQKRTMSINAGNQQSSIHFLRNINFAKFSKLNLECDILLSRVYKADWLYSILLKFRLLECKWSQATHCAWQKTKCILKEFKYKLLLQNVFEILPKIHTLMHLKYNRMI